MGALPSPFFVLDASKGDIRREFRLCIIIDAIMKCRLHTQVLILDSTDLADLLGLLHVNADLGLRRWFAVDAAALGDDLRASARGELFSKENR